MKKAWLILGLVLLTGGLFGQPKTAEYRTMTGQLILKTTAGGSALFQTQAGDYDVWLPRTAALSSITSGTTVSIEGVYTTDASNGLEAPIVHPYKIRANGRVIDLSTAFGWTGQAGSPGVDAISGATGPERPNTRSRVAEGIYSRPSDTGNRLSQKYSHERDRDDEDEDEDD